jgi:hypothetical protein
MVQRFVSTFYKHAHAVVPKSELSATKMGLLAAASSILPLNESDLPGLAFLTIGEQKDHAFYQWRCTCILPSIANHWGHLLAKKSEGDGGPNKRSS